jgi:hypothetical protein
MEPFLGFVDIVGVEHLDLTRYHPTEGFESSSVTFPTASRPILPGGIS